MPTMEDRISQEANAAFEFVREQMLENNDRLLALAEQRPAFKCEWCNLPVMSHEGTTDFKGTSLHRFCNLEAYVTELVVKHNEAIRRLTQRVSDLEGREAV